VETAGMYVCMYVCVYLCLYVLLCQTCGPYALEIQTHTYIHSHNISAYNTHTVLLCHTRGPYALQIWTTLTAQGAIQSGTCFPEVRSSCGFRTV
jgi:hypothetical protein